MTTAGATYISTIFPLIWQETSQKKVSFETYFITYTCNTILLIKPLIVVMKYMYKELYMFNT